ncbi:MAG TPA: helix-hairpin-helix domain-containing protein [Chitinophagaceae bacterium]|nr:helix-hairpin-helix domain-containing protein [Chitinophagaceae bacterium]
MKRKQLIGEYFQFTRKDRIAVLIIALILLASFLLPSMPENQLLTEKPVADTGWITALEQLEKLKSTSGKQFPGERNSKNSYDEYVHDRTEGGYNNELKGELFSFNPNTLSAEGWKKLGLREKTVKTIRNYIEKGGRFRKPEDLQKVYGLREEEYERLKGYVQIETPAPTLAQAHETTAVKPVYPSRKEISVVDVNAADSAGFEALPGIGAKLAMRIIHFREKLGGFYSVEQVGETFGLADSVFQKIKAYLQLNDVTAIHQININTADLDELKSHPYIRYNLAKAIINFRQQHGAFSAVDDLKRIVAVEVNQFEKMKAYLTINQEN